MIETNIRCKIIKENLILKEMEETNDYPKLLVGITPFKIYFNNTLIKCDKTLLKEILKTLNIYDLDLFINYLRKSTDKIKKVIYEDFNDKIPYFNFKEKQLEQGYINLENNLEDNSFNINFYFSSLEELEKSNEWIEKFIEDLLN